MKSLMKKRYKSSKNKPTDLIIAGSSAGAIATYLHCDRYIKEVTKYTTNLKTACLPDSGFFLDYKGIAS